MKLDEEKRDLCVPMLSIVVVLIGRLKDARCKMRIERSNLPLFLAERIGNRRR